MALNKVFLIGNVGKDPEVHYFDSNTRKASFTLATVPPQGLDRCPRLPESDAVSHARLGAGLLLVGPRRRVRHRGLRA